MGCPLATEIFLTNLLLEDACVLPAYSGNQVIIEYPVLIENANLKVKNKL
jgi:hypothetical protein